MPRFSVVVPAYKVQGFLRASLDSVLTQSFTDLEVIAVDDASPDHCAAILAEYTARDPRVTAVHLPENAGVGPARNAGAARARGDYLLFLDGDDTFTPGLLAALDARLRTTGDPDLLLFDHVNVSWSGRGGRTGTAALLAEAGEDTFTVRDRPRYLNAYQAAWNKAYRRDFLVTHGLRYPEGLYEDVPVTYRALIAAERVACLDRVGVEHRQRRQSSVERTPERLRAAMLTQFDALFAFLDAHPAHDWAGPLLLRQAMGHLRAARPDEPGPREEFRRETDAFHRRHAPDGAAPARPRRRTAPPRRLRAVLKKVRGARRTLRDGVVRRLRKYWRAVQLRRPLDPCLAVYEAGGRRGVLGGPAAVHAAARALAPHIKGVWVVNAKDARRLPEGVDHVVPGSPRHAAVLARATYFFNDVDWDAGQAKRPGQVWVQTHRGTPLGHEGLDLRERPAARQGLDLRAALRRGDRWDHSLEAGAYAARARQSAHPCRFTTLLTGNPRNDVLVRGDAARAARARERLGVPAGNTVVLYAPTRRDYRRGGYVRNIDPAALARALGDDHTLVVRLHPSLAKAPERALEMRDLERSGVLVDATDEPHVEDLLLASDALITDYSSLLFDYAVLDRPIVVHADDWEAFRLSRGAYLDITEQPPGHLTRTEAELADVFASGAWCDAESARRRAEFRALYCEADDGHAAERVVRRVLLGETARLPATAAQLPAARSDTAPAGQPVG
ncbi:glycosyltransferase [Streptomyces sp. SID8379]|uniref:bifunctional glycosyltransferase/CDP-glycerol:glycerophosphate glycerophosphotransferase n=1 Tax=unclassified Streptomyces TaxID=2593676 RepID=UPI00035FDC07|nr:bifunctional glycosyltransferase/CDP-glycerol:glycerophosphate glycerophosphotransferase [Streptomyces sp. HmicA12]MYW64717.1 glycosyltransferase [Streptomyces sp. SID8379]